ncbi:plasminogen activator inhibitor 1-like [Paramacrobiotus metropolitanus]|uniref:plasminogen activator inhibitor 1-like n=1 Tax=Paramacrobiotus metropolitanus TaxID=2943436 RepID=UPI002445DAFF|nr:plasminogen activator inhibitor 1-like [Paramacrobiotus metropolitanus]
MGSASRKFIRLIVSVANENALSVSDDRCPPVLIVSDANTDCPRGLHKEMPWKASQCENGEDGREISCCGCSSLLGFFSRQSRARRIQRPGGKLKNAVQQPRCGAGVAVKIYQAVAQAQPPSAGSNLIVCPYSIQHVLFARLLGARDQLRQDLLALLCPDGRSIDDVSAALSCVAGDAAFSQVNAVLYSQLLTLKPSFKDAMLNKSDVVFLPVDFENATAARAAYAEFLEKHESSDMADRLPVGDMRSVLDNPLTSLVLINLLTFSAPWALQFEEKDTRDGVFTCLDGSQKKVPFLISGNTTWTPFNVEKKTAATDPQMVIMEAGEKRYSVMCILPAAAGGEALRQLEESLSVKLLRGWRRQSIRYGMALSLPKFRVNCQLELERGMQALGLAELYSHRTATGFSDMFQECPLQGATAFQHNVVFEVDELGVRSSVATMFSAEYLCVPRPAFLANRPFLLLVWHNQLDVPLFIGRIADPSLTI